MKMRHKIIPASYLVLIKDGKILLLRRYNTGFEDGNYTFVAGHVEKGETFTDCLIREAREEAGVLVKPEDLKVLHVMHRNSLDSERVDVFFTSDKWEGEPKNLEPEKCDDLSWFELDNLPVNMIPFIRHVIESIRKNNYYSEFGWGNK